MLIEIWENLRGYNKWTPTMATVQSSILTPVKFGDVKPGGEGNRQAIAWQSVCKIVWEDQHRVQHTAGFEAYEESPLYQLTERDSISIRFNPDKPAEFYLPGLLQSRLARTWKMAIWAVLAILLFTAFVVAWFGPSILNAFSH